MAFDPKNAILAVGDEDGYVTFSDLPSGEEKRRVYLGHPIQLGRGRNHPVTHMAFSLDGVLLTSCHSRGLFITRISDAPSERPKLVRDGYGMRYCNSSARTKVSSIYRVRRYGAVYLFAIGMMNLPLPSPPQGRSFSKGITRILKESLWGMQPQMVAARLS